MDSMRTNFLLFKNLNSLVYTDLNRELFFFFIFLFLETNLSIIQNIFKYSNIYNFTFIRFEIWKSSQLLKLVLKMLKDFQIFRHSYFKNFTLVSFSHSALSAFLKPESIIYNYELNVLFTDNQVLID